MSRPLYLWGKSPWYTSDTMNSGAVVDLFEKSKSHALFMSLVTSLGTPGVTRGSIQERCSSPDLPSPSPNDTALCSVPPSFILCPNVTTF